MTEITFSCEIDNSVAHFIVDETSYTLEYKKEKYSEDREELWWEMVVEKDSKKVHMTQVVLPWVDNYKLEVKTQDWRGWRCKTFSLRL